MAKPYRLIPLVFLAAGCNPHADMVPFLGKWSGGFQVTEITGGGKARDLKRESLMGYVQVYATSRSYKMELSGEQETIDISGTWSHKGNHITLQPSAITIDDQGGADKRDPNKKFIPAAIAKAAYERPLILQETPDKRTLSGLKISVGKLIGTHKFVNDSF